jgi:hypothetical protein
MQLNRALGRNHELPAYAAAPLQMIDEEFAEFPLALPKLLYLPPRGEYAVRVRASRMGGADCRQASAGTGVVIVHPSATSQRVATLIGPHRLNWGDAFLILEFVEARRPAARQLLNWASSSALAKANGAG